MKVINNNIKQWDGLIKRIAGKYINKIRDNTYETYEDMIQEGRLALLKALNNFDENKGGNFINYASLVIARHLIKKFIKKDNNNEITIDENYDIDTTSITDIDNKIDLHNIIDSLDMNNRYKDILRLRSNGYTYRDIAKKYGCSSQRIKRIIGICLDKINVN